MNESGAALRFLQKLIQTPSLPGQEGDVAGLVLTEMQSLGYDEVSQDEAGNVIGKVRGRGEAPAVMFNTHLDHVDPGDSSAWPDYGQPYSGSLHEGKVWGRAASDIKGPLVAQLYGIAALQQDEDRPPGDVYVTANVQEEVGGLGARLLAERFKEITPLVLVGEPSSNELRRGHRGRVELRVHVAGRSVHASVPAQGVNPLHTLANFIHRLQSLEMARHDELDSSSVAPTVVRTDQTSTNVTPGELWLTLDWRNVPGETAEDAQAKLSELLTASLTPGASGEVLLRLEERVSFTGYAQTCHADMPAFILPADHGAVQSARQVLSRALSRDVPVRLWRFATDGGHYARAGMTVVGFGPGDEAVIHTVNEYIDLQEWEEAMRANAVLAREWPLHYGSPGSRFTA
jgi:succinyl-diaminopimelate desuccinylase